MDTTNSNNISDNKSVRDKKNWPCDFCKPEHYTKLPVRNWLKDIPGSQNSTDIVEIRFKNTRKEYFQNINHLRLNEGDIVAVEASPGHDIGIVSLTGELVLRKLEKDNISPQETEFKNIYRKAKDTDIEKWREAVSNEQKTMIKARQIAKDLKLGMKIGDVEYQGDKTKAIFYYIAEERVDFRELIKILAEEFKIRIEMRQIGTRQESGRIGGIGSCGRELCCSTWLTDFVSVTTNAARHQELSLNPQKLAGQCGKLKCCLNFELDCYIDAQKDFPSTDIVLETDKGQAFHNKTDIFRRIMWYSFDRDNVVNITPVPIDRVKEIIELNNKGQKVEALIDITVLEEGPLDYKNVVGQESLTRFDEKKKKRRKKKSNKFSNNRKKRSKNDKKQKK